MIKTEIISANALMITLPDKLNADDFGQIAQYKCTIADIGCALHRKN